MKHVRLAITHDLWTWSALCAAAIATGILIGLFLGWKVWGSPLDDCLAGDVPRATCEYLFDEGAG